MSKTVTTLGLTLSLLAGAVLPLAPALAEPGGCLKYGAVGAVGGHVAHHGVLGAAGGCVTGMVVRHHYRKEQRREAAAYRAGEVAPQQGGDVPPPR